MKLRIGLDTMMNRLVRNNSKKGEVGGIKVRKVLDSLKDPDNSEFHVKRDRASDVKNYLSWERKELGLNVN